MPLFDKKVLTLHPYLRNNSNKNLKRFKDYDDYFYNGSSRSYVLRYGTLHGYVLERRNQLNPGND